MNEHATPALYGELIEPATLKIQRVLSARPERVWSFLTDSTLRARWLAAGDMTMAVGAPFEFVWRNDDLTDPPGARPAGFPAEHRMTNRIVEVDPPRKLVITWGVAGEVSFDLEPRGAQTLLTLIHRRLPDRASLLNVSAGWHMHLDILVARLGDGETQPFWDGWSKFRRDYDARLPA